MATGWPTRLRERGVFARLGVAGLVLTGIGGAAASGLFLESHHNTRDGVPGLTVNDVVAHYHGIVEKAPLLSALEDGHPEELADRDRELLLSWLRGDPARLSVDYDNLDLGEDAPAEIIATSCLSCHARSSSGEGTAPEIPLDTWDDVESLSISRDIRPIPYEILLNSTHTHALGMSAIGIAIAVLALMTSWPRPLVGLVLGATGVGLAADIGGWWLTSLEPVFAYQVMIGGTMFAGGMSLLGVMVLLDLCLPAPRRHGDGEPATG